jgi:hypothetical protein
MFKPCSDTVRGSNGMPAFQNDHSASAIIAVPIDDVMAIIHLFEMNLVCAIREAIAATIAINLTACTKGSVSP